MRDPSRIYKFCNELAKTWSENAPDMRFGQLMTNIFNCLLSLSRDLGESKTG